MKTTTADRRAYWRKCAKCQAEPGSVCRHRSGKGLRRPHKVRRRRSA